MDGSENQASPAEMADLDCGQLIRRIWQHKILLVGCVALFLLAALAHLAAVPKFYQATTIIEVHEPGSDPVDRGRGDLSEMRLRTVEQKLKKVSVFRHVLERDDVTSIVASSDDLLELAADLARRTRVRWQRGTSLISVTVADEDPELAKQLATALVEEFMEDQIEAHRNGLELRYEQVKEASERMKLKLQEHMEMEVAIHRLSLDEAMEIRSRIEDMESEISDLLGKGDEKAPSLVQGRKRLSVFREQLKQRMSQLEGQVNQGGELWAGLDLKKLSGLTEEERFDSVIIFIEGRADSVGLEVDSQRKLYASLVEQSGELDFLRHIEEPGFRVVETAFLLPGFAGPGWCLILVLAAFLGLVTGLLLIWGKCVCLVNSDSSRN